MKSVFLLLSFLTRSSTSFTLTPTIKSIKPTKTTTTSLFNSNNESNTINNLKSKIRTEIAPTKRGLSTTTNQSQTIENLIQNLESECPLSEPARSPLMGGSWIVDYTTAPPPSNGKLGPFVGYARQRIDLDKGTYENYLSVPGDDLDKEWLSAKLVATFEEWDGEFLEDDRDGDGSSVSDDEDDVNSSEEISVIEEKGDNSNSLKPGFFASFQSIFSGNNEATANTSSAINKKPDYGASNWKVDFQTLTIKAFGITLLTQKFENTSRIWKMSYLDDETRVVRAGRTGKDEDNTLFYMTRE